MLSKSFQTLKTMIPVANRTMSTSAGEPKRVVVTGAAGQISYATLFRIARYALFPIFGPHQLAIYTRLMISRHFLNHNSYFSGQFLGPNQRLILHMLDLPQA
jgi:hypothetical protein